MDSIPFNEMYSTTRLLTSASQLSDIDILSDGTPIRTGGLRSKGFSKSGYKQYQDGWYVYRNQKIEGLPLRFEIELACEELPLITVVTVVFNADKTLEETIKSVIGQSYSNIEYIIIDGGSTDGTLEIIRRYNLTVDYWTSEGDSGIYDAMNKSLVAARGDWLIFMGADDKFASDKSIECVVSRLKDRAAVYYGDVILSKSCKVYGGRFSKYKLMQQNICHQAIFYPENVYAKDAYDLNYKMLADYKYNIDIIGRGVRFIYLPIVVAIFNEAGMSSGGDVEFARDKDKIIRASFGVFYSLIKRARNIAASFHKILR